MVDEVGSVEVEVRANLEPYRRGLGQAKSEAQAFERAVAGGLDRQISAAARRAGVSYEEMARRVANAKTNVEAMRRTTVGAAAAETQLTAAQQRVVQNLQSKILATQLSGRELAVHTALTKAGTAANTAAGRQIAQLAAAHYELAAAQKTSGGGFLTSFASRAAGPLIGAFLGGQVLGAVQRMIKETARIDEVARRFGATTTEVQGFRHEVELATGSIASADYALDAFSQQVGQAAEGTGYLAKLFAANNVELRDQDGNLRSTAALWQDFVRLIANAATEQERMRMATGVLGETGREVVEVLRRGPEALSEAYRQAERDGKFLSQQAINDAKQINKEWTDLAATISVGMKVAVISTINFFRTAGEEYDRYAAGVRRTNKELLDGLADFETGMATGLARTRPTGYSGPGVGLEGMVEHEAGAFLGVPSRLPPPRERRERLNEYEREVRAIERSMVALQAEIQTVGQSEGAIAAHTAKMELERAAIEAKLPLTNSLRGNIEKLAGAYGALVEAMARARLQEDVLFERAQMGRSPMEQAVASRLRGAGLPADLASVEAGMIRVNEQMRLGIEASTEFGSGLLRDLRAGASATEALGNALGRLAERFADLALETGIRMLFGAFAGGIGGGLGGGMGLSLTAPAGLYHSGRGPGDPTTRTRYIHPAYFESAPRFHNGRVPWGSDEMPAVIRKDESVLTPGQMRALGGRGGIQINAPITIDARGAERGTAEEIVAAAEKKILPQITRVVRDARERYNLED